MPEAAAVLERGAAPPEAGAEEDNTSVAQTGAAVDSTVGTERKVQTGQEPNEQAEIESPDAPDEADESDPITAADKARAEALAEKMLADKEAAKAAELAAAEEERLNTERANRHKSLHLDTVVATENAVKALPKLYDELGNPWEWTDVRLDAITAPTKGKNLTIWEDTVAAIHAPIQVGFKSVIPEDKYDAYKKEASGKPIEDHLKVAAEFIAPTTKWASSLTLDEAEKVSKSLKADVAERIRTAIREDRKTPRKAGDVGGNDGRPSPTKATWAEIQKMSKAQLDASGIDVLEVSRAGR